MNIKINEKSSNHIHTQVIATKPIVAPLSSYFLRELTLLSKFLHSIVLRLKNDNVLQLPPIKPIDPSQSLENSFDHKAFCPYHCQDNHDIEKCYRLRHKTQDLIDSNTIYVEGVNDKVNKFVAPLIKICEYLLVIFLILPLILLNLRDLNLLLMIWA